MDREYESLFEGGDEVDVIARKLFLEIPLTSLRDHLQKVEQRVRTASWTLEKWTVFKFNLLNPLYPNIISWGGDIEESEPSFWNLFRIDIESLKTPKECVCVHFAIENCYMAPEYLPSIWDLLPEGWDDI